MKRSSVTHSTFVIERNYSATPEKVFAALADPAKKRRWYADSESGEAEVFEMNFQVGGNDRTVRRMPPGSPFPGVALINQTNYQDIVPNRRVVIAYTMTLGEKRISASLATFELIATERGTDLIFTEQSAFFEGADGPQIREQGWRHLLERLNQELDHK
ncbi:MAG: SRPBCC family protein [Candidatus Acidiferrum sp.]